MTYERRFIEELYNKVEWNFSKCLHAPDIKTMKTSKISVMIYKPISPLQSQPWFYLYFYLKSDRLCLEEVVCLALGTFVPLMANHMFREECYYLSKVAESAGIEKPDCKPAKPRLQS